MSDPASRRIQAVAFDVGETLFDETRAWGLWADWLGVPPFTLFGVLGEVVERGENHRRAFEIVRPGIDLDAESARKDAAGLEYRLDRQDLYPDALPALRDLRDAGYRLAVAANQPVSTEDVIGRLDVEFDVIASSTRWGVAKPEPAFFERLSRELRLPPQAIAYVGDRVDYDIRPVAAAGMTAIHVRRGPWGFSHAASALAAGAAAQIDSLAQLPDVLARLG
ncbi:MAG TPA: HAD family hydrolase [Candidatus Limnocylindrales bacterium]|nr:HAD family hydrolase [Candidatus Limnocylindrales bacterium]